VIFNFLIFFYIFPKYTYFCQFKDSTVQPVSKREYLTNSWNQCKIKKWNIIQRNMKEKLWKNPWFLWKKLWKMKTHVEIVNNQEE